MNRDGAECAVRIGDASTWDRRQASQGDIVMINLRTLEQQEDKILFDMETMIATAKKEERDLTDDQKKQYAAWEKELPDIAKKRDKLTAPDDLGDGLDQVIASAKSGRRLVGAVRFGSVKTAGQRYVDSDAFKAYEERKKSGQLGERWELPYFEIERNALTEDPASGGALVVPDYQLGVISGPTLSIVVADLFAPGTTNSNSVPTIVEKAFTNAAAPVAEGAAKPESDIDYEQQVEPVRKIAHWITVSEELLEDAPAVASQIDSRLRYGVLRVEDQQLLSGSGAPPNLLGVLNRPGLAPAIARVDPQTNADAILAQIIAIESTTGYPVSGIVINQLAWGGIVGSKATDGTYLAGGPFGTATAPMLWGRPVALTNQIAADVALVGAFKQAGQVFRHGPVRVNSSNSHQDYFVRNLVAVRAEERLALAVYRAAAFGTVTGLTSLPPAAP